MKMRKAPALDGMPDFHDSLEWLRHRHHLSRESAAQHAGFSSSYLHRLIRNRTYPGPRVFTKLADAFDLDSSQRRHLHELWQPSLELPPAEELRQRLTGLGIQAHLDHLDTRYTLAVYLDPLRTVLHGNRIFHRMVPGLAEADNNYFQWMFSPAARDRIHNWDNEARYTVTILRGPLGRYRDLPRARMLFQRLRTTPEFPRIWESTPMQVTYDRPRPTPIHVHTPGTDKPLPLNLEISDYPDCPHVLLAYGLYDTSAIAS
ncbi:helix-turn-helix domain-containing protein [Nocardia asiatica]|uniref:helix-turn-helix domain-containing protein n=1 Tax=Nocardia asiatica TaxID=209252 RepID=UPI0024572375|nr:helix-turn-helix domain-containing protein [Nocardia asiatica]